MAVENLSTMVQCPHREDCCDIDTDKCKQCANNKKRSYFSPIYVTYRRFWPYYPYVGNPRTYTTTSDPTWDTSCNTSYFTEA